MAFSKLKDLVDTKKDKKKKGKKIALTVDEMRELIDSINKAPTGK